MFCGQRPNLEGNAESRMCRLQFRTEPEMVHYSSRRAILRLEDADDPVKAKAAEPPMKGGSAKFCRVSTTSENRSESPPNLNGGEHLG